MKKIANATKPAAKPAAKKTAVKAAKAPVAKKATKAPANKCGCSKSKEKCNDKCKCDESKECKCEKEGCKCNDEFCFETLITEIFGQLSDEAVLAALMQDYFYTELLKKGFEENTANTLANKIIVDISSFEANVDFKE